MDGPEAPHVGSDSNAQADITAARYLPKPPEQRRGIALCLSGGGFRAAIFHMGALRRLNELGILSKVDTISAVSGGSIVAAHLAETIRNWPAPGDVIPDWQEKIAAPFRRFTAADLATCPILQKLLPWNLFRTGAQTQALRRRYHDRLTSLMLSDLPDRPEYIFCATDLVFAANWEFSRKRTGDWRAGYAQNPQHISVAAAVAASSSFPPLFEPIPLPVPPETLKNGRFQPEQKRLALLPAIRLTDGGVYDNMGLEPVWKNSRILLVSDGGAPFQYLESKMPWRLLKRYVDVASRQGAALRKRWLISQFLEGVMQGAYWGVSSASRRYDRARHGYSKELAENTIARIRTDMNPFDDAEAAVLENHGYLLADAAVRTHISHFIAVEAPPQIPHPQWMDEHRVMLALQNSRKILTLKRIRDLFRRHPPTAPQTVSPHK